MEDMSKYLGERLSNLPKRYPSLFREDIRGRGFMRGLGIKDPNRPGSIVQLSRDRGVLLLTAGADAVRIVPSLTVGKEEIDLAVDVLEAISHDLQ